jgi:hypothetical protein
MKTLRVTDDEISVLLQSLYAMGWKALPKRHPELLAFESVERKLLKLVSPLAVEKAPAE